MKKAGTRGRGVGPITVAEQETPEKSIREKRTSCVVPVSGALVLVRYTEGLEEFERVSTVHKTIDVCNGPVWLPISVSGRKAENGLGPWVRCRLKCAQGLGHTSIVIVTAAVLQRR